MDEYDEMPEKIHMLWSACRNCDQLGAYCFKKNKGFYCSEGYYLDNFIPFGYPFMDKEGKTKALKAFERNELPEDCRFHTQCSMMNFMDNGKAIAETVDEPYEIEEVDASKIDVSSEKAFQEASSVCHNLFQKTANAKKSTVFLLKRDGLVHGFLWLTLDNKKDDFSWITPVKPTDHFLKDGTRVGIRFLYDDKEVPFAKKLLLMCAFGRAVEKNVDEIYALAYSSMTKVLEHSGFRMCGYKLGGDGSDNSEAAATVMVRWLCDKADDDEEE